MSEAETAGGKAAAQQRLVSELKVSGHLMNLDTGLFCIVQTAAKASDPSTGLPGVRISLPPGAMSRPDAVSISSFRGDGWLNSGGDAALVRVNGGPAQILVTVYQVQGTQDAAPNIQVLRLLEPAAAAAAPPAPVAVPPRPPAVAAVAAPQAPAMPAAAKPEMMDMLAHIQGRGDVGGHFGDWLGNPGSKQWIEGFALAPLKDVAAGDIEYQAVLGRGWLSPWVDGGQFCGSRGMALPILGLRVRLKGASGEKFDCRYSASFLDGTSSGPAVNGAPCESDSLAAVEAFKVEVYPKQATSAAAAQTGAKPAARKPARKV